MAAVVQPPRLLPKHSPPPPPPPPSIRLSLHRHGHRLTPFPLPPPSCRRSPLLSLSSSRRLPLAASTSRDNTDASEAVEDEKGEKPNADDDSARSVAAELKAMMAAKREKEKEKGSLMGGVWEEIREIEWPAFGRVVGTTGVVLAVIAGSSVALLTVNAVLAEISDRVFAGKGLQDFFGG